MILVELKGDVEAWLGPEIWVRKEDGSKVVVEIRKDQISPLMHRLQDSSRPIEFMLLKDPNGTHSLIGVRSVVKPAPLPETVGQRVLRKWRAALARLAGGLRTS